MEHNDTTKKGNEKIIVGLDGKRIVRNGTGLGSYGRTLANDMAALGTLDLRVYAPDQGRDALRSQVPEGDCLHYCYPHISGFLSGPRKALWRTHGIVKELVADGIQIYHGLSGELPIGIRKTGIKTVVTIHDLIFLRHPEYYNPIDVKMYAWKFRQTLREADAIVAISECTRRDICEFGGIAPERVELIYQSCALRFDGGNLNVDGGTRKVDGLPEKYVLTVGTIEERKNALLTVKALAHLPEDIHLVLVGRRTPYTKKIEAWAETNGVASRLHILTGVSDEQLPSIYAGAAAFAYPSRYEGFGIPIIEAVSMGLPVVACSGSCLEEAGGSDSLYVGPDDVEGMARAILLLLQESDAERMERVSRSREYIRRFANTDAALKFEALYRRLVK